MGIDLVHDEVETELLTVSTVNIKKCSCKHVLNV